MKGDKLAAGAKSASFGNSDIKVTQKEWDERVGNVETKDDTEKVKVDKGVTP